MGLVPWFKRMDPQLTLEDRKRRPPGTKNRKKLITVSLSDTVFKSDWYLERVDLRFHKLVKQPTFIQTKTVPLL